MSDKVLNATSNIKACCMEFIQNLLIIDKSSEQRNSLVQGIEKATKKIAIFTLDSRLQIAETAAQNKITCLFLNTNIGKKDVFFILRFFNVLSKKEGKDIPIFLTSEDFHLLQEITAEFPSEKIKILHTPLDEADLIKKIQISMLGKVESVSQNKNSKDPLDINLEFVNVFITSTNKVISGMAQIQDLTHSPPLLMANIKTPLNIAISSKILISSTYFKGSYYIAFPKETFLNFYEVVVMEKQKDINDENKDFASELANIIYGQCKKKFSDEGVHLDMIIPSLHVGEIVSSVVIIIPFDCYLGKFYLAVAPGLI
jgi:chemotaxis protein CheX